MPRGSFPGREIRGGEKQRTEERSELMRKILGLATAFTALLALTAAAIAGQAGPSPSGQLQTLEASHAPAKASKKKKKTGTKVKIVLTLKKSDGTKPSPTVDAIVSLPKGMGLNYTKFPQCDINKLKSQGTKACPKGSKVGTGRLEADASPVLAKVGGTVTAFNGKSKTYLLYIVPEISSPLVIPGKLQGKSTLDFDVPLVPTLPGQPNATLTYFEVTTGAVFRKKVKGKRKKFNYLENPAKCPSGGYPWKIAFRYENGESLAPTDPAPC
jgi:hypothetical protein